MRHSHDHGDDHDHHHHHHHVPHSTRGLRIAFFLNLSFTIVEAVGGWWTQSIAVMTDALHDMGDSVVLGAAWYLQTMATRGRDVRYSYGYGRFSMLGGWLAAGMLIVGSILVFVFAIPRLFEPVLPHTLGMIGLGIFGLVMNSLAAWTLHGGTSLNERGAYLHLLEDVLGWAAVLVGAVIMHFTGFARLDPLLSMVISIYILYNAVRTLRSGTRILMQAQPAHIELDLVRSRLRDIPDVIDVHDQHTWTLDGSYMIHTVHLVVAEQPMKDIIATKAKAREILTSMGIHHATIEIELPGEDCGLEHH